jgi:hypothetical protein
LLPEVAAADLGVVLVVLEPVLVEEGLTVWDLA